MKVEGKFNLDKILKDGRKSPKEMHIPDDMDILVFDQHREKLPDGSVVESKRRAIGLVTDAIIDNKKLVFNWEITDPGILNLAKTAKYPEKLFTYSPEHWAKNKTQDYPQGEIGVLDAIAVTNLNNDEDAITTRIFNSFVKLIKGKGDEMDAKEVKEIIQNYDMTDKITEVMKEKIEILDSLEQNMEKIDKIDFDKIQENLEKLEMIQNVQETADKVSEMETKLNDIVQNMNEGRDALIKQIIEGSDFTEEELVHFSTEKLEKISTKFGVELEGSGEGIIQNNKDESPEKVFEKKFGVKVEDI